MDEGKLDIKRLEKILKLKGFNNDGIISSGEVGADAASLDISLAQRISQQYYNDFSDVYLIIKSDPVTFPTSEPGKYAVIVNSNDIACTGAIPYGFLSTIIAPKKTNFKEIETIQKQIHQQCIDLEISLLGGHTEISDSVEDIIISGHMIGFVPKESYIQNQLIEGESIIIAGEIGAEGVGIIISEASGLLNNILEGEELKDGIEIGNKLSISQIANVLNKKFHPTLIHDATEGGLYGALSELLQSRNVGISLLEEPRIHPVLKKLSKWLEFDPYRVISSGLIIIAIPETKTDAILNYLSQNKIPCSLIGSITSEKGILRLGKQILEKPKGDEIIIALKNLERIKNER